MKKLIVLSLAAIMLLFGCAAFAEITPAKTNVTLCEDITPWGNPRDITETTLLS